ncbi:Polysialic acid transport protein KpsM [Flavimaricola marinus]|uniref:Polysialic acid transport protein KpsM n=2 Tax=Flavimaricola marinus TaxID=1819565 RepID=A0A238LJV1_9RHOB|nr:Polysialic acid transport protein KpsM [Flavimaricola marinus]
MNSQPRTGHPTGRTGGLPPTVPRDGPGVGAKAPLRLPGRLRCALHIGMNTDDAFSLPQLARSSAAVRTARTITALMLREMGSTYGRSPGGYLWVIAEPIGVILVLSIAFSLMLRSPSLGTSFMLYYATGYMPFSIYTELANKTQSALNYSRPLLAYPGVTWLDAVLARFFLNLITGATVSAVLFTGILTFVDTQTVLDIGPILTGMGMAACLGLGVGTLNCVLFGLFPIWRQLWGVATRPLFLASGILFLYEDLPSIAQDILWWNPLIHVVGWTRTGFYTTYHASYVSLTYCFGLGLGLLALGLIFLRAHYKRVLEQ